MAIDPSIPAVQAGDYTIATSACGAVPGRGMDVCHVREGTRIESSWVMIVPNGKGVIDGEVDVYYRDVHRHYPITDSIVQIPWAHFFQSEKWSTDMDGEALALVLVRYKDPQGIIEVAKFRGIAKIVVTKEGYDRLPLDSGFAAWKTVCKIQYSTAGRSAISCK